MKNKDSTRIFRSLGLNNIKTIDRNNETFNFSCSICGKCCKDRDDIILSPYDIFKLSKGLKISSTNILKKYCDICLEDNNNLPSIILQFDKGINYTFCPFLKFKDNLYKCEVHEYKPSVCALFPLGRISRGDKTSEDIIGFDYIIQYNNCGSDEGEKHTIKEWLNNSNMVNSEQAFIDWSNCVLYLEKTMDLEKVFNDEKISNDTRLFIYNGILNGLYSNMNTENDILKELNKKYERTKYFVDFMVTLHYFVFDNDIRGINYSPNEKTIREVKRLVDNFNKDNLKNLGGTF